jgi:hypothetical protein
MQYFFNDSSDLDTGSINSPTWNYAKAGLTENIKRAVEYYRERPFALNSKHLLVRFVQSFGVSMTKDIRLYSSIVDARALNMAMAFKMSSSVSVGSIFNGTFYGKHSKEIIIGHNDPFDVIQTSVKWKEAKPLRVLLTIRDDPSMLLPDGNTYSANEGMSVIAINIPMLAVMYRGFCLDQYERLKARDDNIYAPAQFIRMYVLPNMLESQTDAIMFNRFMNLLRGAPMLPNRTRPAFVLPDYTRYVDRFYNRLIGVLTNARKDFNTILKMIPAPVAGDFKEMLRVPDYAPTRQIFWADVLTRIDAVDMLTSLTPDHGRGLNMIEINYFLRQFQMLKDNNIFASAPQDVRYETMAKIRDIQNRF